MTTLTPAAALKMLKLDKQYPGSVNTDGLIDIIKTSPQHVYLYARDVVGGEWKEGELILATNARYACEYAIDCLKSIRTGARFYAGEATIVNHPKWAYYYAKDVMHTRWPEAEHVILADEEWVQSYVNDVICADYIGLNTRWPEAEAFIASAHPYGACYYAKYVLSVRWPEAEATIKTDEHWWNHYCKHFDIV